MDGGLESSAAPARRRIQKVPALAWEVPDDLVQYFERARSRERQRQSARSASARGQDALVDARDRLRGRKTWTVEERARLVHFMQVRRAAIVRQAECS
jgi:hypothetical protein